jgi:hypothetical protein
MGKQQTKPKAKAGPVALNLRSKFGKPLGFRTPDHFKGKTFGGKGSGGFDPARFKTQHKG